MPVDPACEIGKCSGRTHPENRRPADKTTFRHVVGRITGKSILDTGKRRQTTPFGTVFRTLRREQDNSHPGCQCCQTVLPYGSRFWTRSSFPLSCAPATRTSEIRLDRCASHPSLPGFGGFRSRGHSYSMTGLPARCTRDWARCETMPFATRSSDRTRRMRLT